MLRLIVTSLLLVLLVGCSTTPAEPVVQIPQPPPDPWLLSMRDQVQLVDTYTVLAADGTLFCERTETQWVLHHYKDGSSGYFQQRMHYFHCKQVTADQLTDLQKLLSDFDQLSADPYGGAPDGPQIQLAHGTKLVTGGSDAPPAVWAIREQLWNLVRNAPVVYLYTPDVDERLFPEPEEWEPPDQKKKTSDKPRRKRPPTSQPTTRRSH